MHMILSGAGSCTVLVRVFTLWRIADGTQPFGKGNVIKTHHFSLRIERAYCTLLFRERLYLTKDGPGCIASPEAEFLLALIICSILQNPSLISREGLASAAVLLAAVAALPGVPHADLAAALAAAMWPELQPQHSRRDQPPDGPSQGSAGSSLPSSGQAQGSLGILGEHLQKAGTSLTARLAGMEPLSRVCSIKGLVSVLPLPALCAPLPLQQPSSGSAAASTSGAESLAAPATDSSQRGGHTDEPRSFPALDEKFSRLGGQDTSIPSAAWPGDIAVPGRPSSAAACLYSMHAALRVSAT